MTDTLAELAWQVSALCAETGPDAFFPEQGVTARDARSVCMGCNVRTECLNYALDNNEQFGIWGGLTERERRHIRRSNE
ncbi:WhiB family transcriptional regulator [Streptomyces sp. NBC_01201]|uniref:WhiB family transcriptional regulator n=1 Tax=Streptomyces sp. NBC_01201 TaxID=2903770 RepID=UPI002E0E7B3D|nr:WhiB family transcriptional regulator [Streptomyces sp. NBC_01201]